MDEDGRRSAETRIRRVRRLQVGIVGAVALVSAVAAVLVSLNILATGTAREKAERVERTLGEVKNEISSARADYWQRRAATGDPSIPADFGARFASGSAALLAAIDERAGIPEERPSIDAARSAAAELGRLVATDLSDVAPGSVEDLRFVARADATLAAAEAAIGDWRSVLAGEIAERSRADDRLVTRLLIALGGLVATLIGAGVLLWAATERVRRGVVAEITAERDATAAVIASVQDGVAVIDAQGRIAEANTRLAELVGVDRELLIGARPPWADQVPPGFVGEMDVELPSAAVGSQHVLLTASTLPDDRAEGGSVHILKDVTERMRSARELQDRAAEQDVLRRVATVVAAGAEPADVFDLVAREVARLLGVEAGVVTRFDPIAERGIDVGVWVEPSLELERPPARVPLDGEAPVARVFQTGAPVRVDDLREIDATSAELFVGAGYRAAVAAPVTVGTQRWGAVVALTTGAGPIAAGAEDRIHRFAELVGLTVANADARARLASQAATDPLTGLANHRNFHERLEQEVEAATAAGGELALVVFDLDRFKDVNDAFGHQTGDDVLAEAARRLAGEARFGELVARIGGEEFAWIMPGSDGINAWRAAERARRAVAATAFPGGVGFITASAGVADLTQAPDAASLMRLADGALYWAKANGRNVTLRYSPEVVKELSDAERAERLARSQAVTALRALARAVDIKDPSTARHAERVAAVAVRLAAELGWGADRLLQLEEAALLHDVGKIGVPDALLFKPQRLDVAERRELELHASLGAEIVSDVLDPEQVSWVRGHHERWDGAGYPDGLAERSIPDGARIIAVADAWDAMTSVRVYGTPRTSRDALDEVDRCTGTQFAPDVAQALHVLWNTGRLTLTSGADAASPAMDGGA